MRVNPSVGLALFAILQRTERIKVKSLRLRGLERLRDREREMDTDGKGGEKF